MLKTVANLHVQGIFSRLHLRYSIRYLHELRMDAKNSPEKIPYPLGNRKIQDTRTSSLLQWSTGYPAVDY